MRRFPWLYRVAPALLVAALAVSCDSPTELQVFVTSVTLEARGDVAQLEARVEGSGPAPRWESLDPEIVTVTEAGLATAVAPGTATVQVHVGSHVADGRVTVLPPVDVRLSELAVVTDPSGAEGMAMRIRNHGGRGFFRLEFWDRDDRGQMRRVLFYATDSEADAWMNIRHESFLLDEPADWVAAYSREPVATEHVRTSCVALNAERPCPAEFPDPSAAVDSVHVTPGAAVLEVGDSLQYSATAFDANGVELTGRAVAWSTPSPDVISVSASGLVRALAAGYGEVRATVDGVGAAVGLTVPTPEPASPVLAVMVQPSLLRFWVGQGLTLEATVLDEGGQPVQGGSVAWSVLDTAVATVDSAGFVNAVGHGETYVVASAGGVNGYANVKSFARAVDGAELSFFATSSAANPPTVEGSIDTTWVDGNGVEHEAFLTVTGGGLSMEWNGAGGSYTQRLELTTFILEEMTAKVVEVSEYVDTGALAVWYDYSTGIEGFTFTSEATAGLSYSALWSIPGELAVEQPVGTVAERAYYFHLEPPQE